MTNEELTIQVLDSFIDRVDTCTMRAVIENLAQCNDMHTKSLEDGSNAIHITILPFLGNRIVIEERATERFPRVWYINYGIGYDEVNLSLIGAYMHEAAMSFPIWEDIDPVEITTTVGCDFHTKESEMPTFMLEGLQAIRADKNYPEITFTQWVNIAVTDWAS